MSKNISIQEGGVGRQFTVERLKTALVGGGSCTWVPEDETQLSTLNASENGTYTAADEGHYGYSKVAVNVAGGAGGSPGGIGSSLVGVDPDTGEDTLIKVDNRGHIQHADLPSTIKVETRPDKTIYADGDLIDYSGMVVKACLNSGEAWTDLAHPGGVIPINELILPEKYADIDKSEAEHWETQGKVYVGSVLAANNLYYEKKTVGRAEYIAHDQSQPIAIVERNGKVGAWSLYRNASPFFVAYMGNGKFLWATAFDDNGGGFKASNISVSSAWGTGSGIRFTYDGKTVYWGDNDFYDEWMTRALIQESEIIDPERTAWAMIFGNIPASSGEALPIQWARPGDRKILDTSVDIMVDESDESIPQG